MSVLTGVDCVWALWSLLEFWGKGHLTIVESSCGWCGLRLRKYVVVGGQDPAAAGPRMSWDDFGLVNGHR